MSTLGPPQVIADSDYPTSDGRPMAETDDHRELMNTAIKTLQARFADQPKVYVSGNLLVFYERGNRRKHLAPDVFVVRGVEKRRRPNYLIWQEGKGPEVVIELTSSSTRDEDMHDKFHLYEQVLQVTEYFLFDPHGDYLTPRLQGYRLAEGHYVPVEPVDGRLPSEVLGLHLEQASDDLRLYDPALGQWLPTSEEQVEQAATERDQAAAERQQARAAQQRAHAERDHAHSAQQRAEAERDRAEAEREQARSAQRLAEVAREQAEAERDRLRRELDELRRRPPGTA